MDRLMILIKSHPQRGRRAGDGLRLAASMIGMDLIPAMAFIDDGVYCLRGGSLDESSSEYLRAVSDLAGVHVLSKSLAERGLDVKDLDPNSATPVDAMGLVKMLIECDATATF